ncbi:MAG TPA: hypothetical protein VMT00_14950 [Thermoanaerobaculia bacterium]|nr:hypothetical protein [Thermoanaerobaculia bacterium]
MDESSGPVSIPAATDGSQKLDVLRGVVERLLDDLTAGSGDKDKRRQVEEWLRNLAEKYPEFEVDRGLREYYLAEAARLRADFDAASDLTEKLAFGRAIEAFLDKAADLDRRLAERA